MYNTNQKLNPNHPVLIQVLLVIEMLGPIAFRFSITWDDPD